MSWRTLTRGHSWSLVPRGHSWSLVCTFRYNRVQHLHEQTAFVTIIFKTLLLIRLTRILSYTSQARKQQIPKLSPVQTADDNTTHTKDLITWVGLASSAKVTFIPLFYEKGQPGGTIFIIQRLDTLRLSSVLPAVLFLAGFVRRTARQAWLLGKFPPEIPVSQYWDPS